MKRLLFAGLVVLALMACGPEKPKRQVTIEQGPAQIAFDETVCDFGARPYDSEVLTHDFTFVNKGGLPLVIQKVVPSCGCLKVEYPKEPIPAGEEGVIKVTLDTSGESKGYLKRTVSVYSNATNLPESRLCMTGTVLHPKGSY